MNSIELLTEVYRRRESGEATACQTCVSKCLSDKLEKGNQATDQDQAICFSECGCSNEKGFLDGSKTPDIDSDVKRIMADDPSREHDDLVVALSTIGYDRKDADRASRNYFDSHGFMVSENKATERGCSKEGLQTVSSNKLPPKSPPFKGKGSPTVVKKRFSFKFEGDGEQNGNGGGNGMGNGEPMNGEPEPEPEPQLFNRLFPFGRVQHQCPDGQHFSSKENKCVKDKATELNDSERAKIFNWMERIADDSNNGQYFDDLADQAGRKFNITATMAENIWGSQGLEEVRATEQDIISRCKTCGFVGGMKDIIKHSDDTGHDDIELMGATKEVLLIEESNANEIGIDDIEIARKWNGASEFQRSKMLKRAGHGGVGSDGGPPLTKLSFQGLPRSVQDDVIEFDIAGEGRPIPKGQKVEQWFNDMGRRALSDIGMDFQAGIMTPEFRELSVSQKKQVRMEFDEQKSIDSGFTKENCGCKFTKYAGESVRQLEKIHGKEVAFMYGKITSLEGKKIKGTLAYAGVSHNNRLYLPEELQKGDMMNLPMIFNHASPDGAEFELSRLPNQIRESILNHEHIRVGDVKLHWDPENLTLFYEGEVNDEFFIKEIDQGLMSVSLGMLFDADSPEICDQECYTAVKGSEFTEVSLVYHPGFPIATIESNEIRLKKRITPRRYKIE